MIGMAGRLRLVVGLDGAGHCALKDQFNSQLHRVLQLIPGDAPEEGVIYLLNPTGGIVQGDELEAEIRVARGAHALSGPRLRGERDAVLEYLPEPLIPHAGARFVEELELDLEEGGRTLGWEILASGRAARGESLAYERLELRLGLRAGEEVVLRERGAIVPSEGLDGPAVLGEFSCYGILWAVGGEESLMEEALREFKEREYSGVTRLRRGVVLKVLD